MEREGLRNPSFTRRLPADTQRGPLPCGPPGDRAV